MTTRWNALEDAIKRLEALALPSVLSRDTQAERASKVGVRTGLDIAVSTLRAMQNERFLLT